MNLFFDESGNTGENLLDKEQPVFVLVSHNFTKDESEDLLSNFLTSANELHFKNLRKYTKHHGTLELFLNHELINYSRIKIAYYYKKFALCAHLVDHLAEAFYHFNGLSFYDGGLNIMFANTLYMHTEIFELKAEFTELLKLFQVMHRTKSKESISEFYKKAKEIRKEYKKYGYSLNFFDPIYLSHKYIDQILAGDREYLIDLTFPSITLLSDIWYKETGEYIDIIHDESKALKAWEDTLLSVSNKDIPDKSIGFDKRTMIFPLKINSILHVNSKDYPQIQVADLIGSSFAYYAKNILLGNNAEDSLARRIENSKLGNMTVHPLLPNFDFDPTDYT